MLSDPHTVTLEGWLAGTAAGLIACAALMAGNIRDREQDKAVGKRTLAVLIGDLPARIVYAVLMLAPFGILAFFVLFYENAYLVYFALLAAIPAAIHRADRQDRARARGRTAAHRADRPRLRPGPRLGDRVLEDSSLRRPRRGLGRGPSASRAGGG